MNEKFTKETALLTVPEAAQMLRVSEHTLYLWLRSGKLKSVRPGRRWLIPEDEIRELLEDTQS